MKNIKLLSWFNFSYSFNLYYGIVIIYFVQVTHSFALGISILSITHIADALFEIPTGMYSELQREFTDRQRATMASINSFLGSVFFAIFGAIFGIFADRVGPAISLLIAHIFLSPMILIYWLVFHAEKQHKPV